MASSMESTGEDHESKKEKQKEYESACREKCLTGDKTEKLKSEVGENEQETNDKPSAVQQLRIESRNEFSENMQKPLEEMARLGYPKKVVVLYELLSACLADKSADNKKTKRRRKGYDARHRVALHLLATWFDVKWIKMVYLLYYC